MIALVVLAYYAGCFGTLIPILARVEAPDCTAKNALAICVACWFWPYYATARLCDGAHVRLLPAPSEAM